MFAFSFFLLLLSVAKSSVFVDVSIETVKKSPHDSREFRAITLRNGGESGDDGAGDLKAVLVHDALADSASAGIRVAAGSLDNSAAQGFAAGDAHFLEHMLFLGSKRFPGEASFAEQLAAHAGYDNAFTSGDRTVYFFVCAPDGLNDTLAIWSQFFVAPLLTASSVSREASAVSAEHAKNVNDDDWRQFSLIKRAANQTSAFARFSTGTYQTLLGVAQPPVAPAVAQAASDRMRRFFNYHYIPPNLRLVVVSPQPLDTVQSAVLAAFSSLVTDRAAATRAATAAARQLLPGADASINDTNYQNRFPFSPERLVPPFAAAGQLGRWMRAVPESPTLRRLTVYFAALPPEDRRLKPMTVVQYLLNRDDDRSCLAALRAANLATSLAAYTEESTVRFAVLTVTLRLTAVADPERAASFVYGYLRKLSLDAVQLAQMYHEQVQLAQTDFLFSDRPSPDQTIDLSEGLFQYGIEEAVRGPSVLFGSADEDNPSSYVKSGAALALWMQTHLTVRRSIVLLEEPLAAGQTELPNQQTVAHYGVKFNSVPLSARLLAALSNATLPASLGFPAPNRFIPTDFALLNVEAVDSKPVRLAPPGQLGLHPVDMVFHQTAGPGALQAPKLEVRARLVAPVFATPWGSVDHAADVALYAALVQALAEQRFGGSADAGLSFSVGHDPAAGALSLSVSGYSDRRSAPQLARELAGFAVNWTALNEAGQLAVAAPGERSRLISSLDAAAVRAWPVRLCLRNQRHLMATPAPVPAEHAIAALQRRQGVAAAATRELASLQSIAEAARRFGHVDFLSVGNVDATEAQSMLESVTTGLTDIEQQFTAGSVSRARAVRLPAGARVMFTQPANDDETNAGVVLLLQIGGDTTTAVNERDRAIMRLLTSILYERAFNQLRTQDGLGYIVWAYFRVEHESGAMVIAVQSAVASNAKVTQHIDRFLAQNFLPAVRAICGVAAAGNSDIGSLPSFEELVEAAVTQRLQHPQTLADLANSQWSAVHSGTLDFEPAAGLRDAQSLRALTRQDVLHFLKRNLSPESSRRLLVWTTPPDKPGSAGHEESDRAQQTAAVQSQYTIQLGPDTMAAWQAQQLLGSASVPVDARLAAEARATAAANTEAPTPQPAAPVGTMAPTATNAPSPSPTAPSSTPSPSQPPFLGTGAPTPSPPCIQKIVEGTDTAVAQSSRAAAVLGVIAALEFVLIGGFLVWLRRKRSYQQLDDSHLNQF